jgi:hypothetical protein
MLPDLAPQSNDAPFTTFAFEFGFTGVTQFGWTEPWGLYDHARLEDDGTTLFTSLRVDREYMFAGLFYGVEGMRVGGVRRLRIAPHLAYRETGVPGIVPPNAILTLEVAILSERREN